MTEFESARASQQPHPLLPIAMPPGPLSDDDYKFIEEMAQKSAKYSRIRKAQTVVFRSNVPEYEAALAQYLQKTAEIHGGKNWQPPRDKVDEYIEECDKICEREIKSIEDRILIYYAAHAASACLILMKIGSNRKEAVHLAIIRRTNELLDKSRPPTPPGSSQQLEPTNTINPVVPPTGQARPLTPLEVEQFMKNFGLFEDKRFVLKPDAPDDVATYEVITHFRRTGEYEVLFEDSEDDPVKVCKEELREMLKASQILV